MEPVGKNGKIYEFDGFELIPAEDLLLRHGEPVPLNQKALRVLALLLEYNGHLVTKSEIIESVWEDAFVEEGSLTKAIWTIRHALGDASKERFIQTIPRRGYRFIFPVSVVTGRSGAFRLTHLNELDGQDRVLTEQKPIPVPSKAVAPVRTIGVENGGSATGLVSKRSRPPFLTRPAVVMAGLGAIVFLAAVFAYFGFVRNISAERPRTIAVLPVAPLNTADRSDLYELGIAESLINQLSSADRISVRQLNAVAAYAKAPIDPLAAGREQDADYVLVSNYQIANGEIKITSQLYNVNTEQVEDTFRTRQSIKDIFAAQDAIAADISGGIMSRFRTFALAPLKKRGTNNEEAYLNYLHGMYSLDRQNPSEDTSPIDFFDRAVSLDPNYAKAWAGKAMAHNYAALSESNRSGEHHRRAQEAVYKALAIDPNESLAYSALCHQRLFDEWNFSGAEEAGRRSVELDPTSSFARSEYSAVLTSRGRFGEAIDQLKKAMESEPTSFRVQAYYANTLFMARRYEEAAAQYKSLVNLKPDRPATYSWLIRVMEAQGKEAEAFDWTVKYMIASNKGDEAIQRYKAAYENSGYEGALYERIHLGVMPVHAYVKLGNTDKAFEALEESFKRRNYYLAAFGVVDPTYDPLRGDARWTDLIQRVEAGGG